MNFVLDASVTLSWLLRDASGKNSQYAFAVLNALRVPDAAFAVPVTWALEVANVISRSEAKRVITATHSEAFLEMLQGTAAEVDAISARQALGDTLQLARRYRLSAYDASYLELALRLSLPLATLDEDLRRAAEKAGVKRFNPR